MPGSAHEVLLVALHEAPGLLDALVTKLRGISLPPGLEPVDSIVRFVKAAEIRPDLLFARARGPWAIVELQRNVDADKRRRWLLAASVLFDRTGVLGDVIVITARRAVARWAHKVAHVRTELGTRLALTPVVLHLGTAEAKLLLDEQHPELALFAAWAMHHRHGPEARAVVEEAIELTELLPAPLQEAQMHAILSVLSDRMLAALREAAMNLGKIPERPAVRKLRLLLEARGEVRGKALGEAQGEARGEARGRVQALLTLLDARGLAVSPADRATIEACTDTALLDQWIRRAATVASVREVLKAKPTPAAPQRRPRRARAAGSPRG